MNNIMLDLEFLGHDPRSVIVSIGAVKFDDKGVRGEFTANIDIQSSINAGLTVDGPTLLWWMEQSKIVRRATFEDTQSLHSALREFTTWCGDSPVIWGNGCIEDNVKLMMSYKAARQAYPAEYTDNRCYRTMKNLYPDVTHDWVGDDHVALDDARNQARHLIKILKRGV